MTAQKETVAVVGTGDMGHAVGGALVRAGYRVVTAGQGRSALSQRLAAEAGIEESGSLEAVVRRRGSCCRSCRRRRRRVLPRAPRARCARPACGPCSPTATPSRRRRCRRSSGRCARPARRSSTSASSAAGRVGRRAHALLCVGRGARGRARASTSRSSSSSISARRSAQRRRMKMAYSALNKGTDALLAAVLLAAERLGVREPLMRELGLSQTEALEAHASARAVLGRDGASGSRPRWPRSRHVRERRRHAAVSSRRRVAVRARRDDAVRRARRARRSRSSARSTRRSRC